MKYLDETSNTESPSVKMVLSGEENYNVNGRRYTLDLDHYLIVDCDQEVEITIDSKNEVNGICIFPNKNLLNEVAKTQLASTDSLLDDPFDNNEIRLVHNQLKFSENRTGKYLKNNIPTVQQLLNDETVDFQEFYMGLAESMVYDQLDLEGKLKQVASAKRTTREELYRRVLVAKYFLEDNFTQTISLDKLAQEASLSKYHFTRTFKALFGLSPYQHILHLRLQKAKELRSKDYSYREISMMIGFSDHKNLRKALKKIS
ncbi:MAG: AraC family transcriptional regulator [Saprospiraceae bacterium]|nr:AraC family transcriptional regulator [Saprospiraceae bacterium]